MANKHETLASLFTDIANAIRTKTGGTESIVADDFPSAINEIETQGDIDLDAYLPIYGEITTPSDGLSITLPGAIGKSNVMVSYLGDITIGNNGYVSSIDIQGDTRFINISYENYLVPSEEEGEETLSYDSSTGTISLLTSVKEYFGAGRYTYVAWNDGNVIVLINLKLGGIDYKAVNGTTWAEWVDSVYNTDGYRVENSKIVSSNGETVALFTGFVKPTDLILSNGDYLLAF